MLDVAKFVEGIHDYIARAFAPIVARLAALESRQAERGEKGDPGERGADGSPGRDADPIDPASLEPMIAEHVVKAVAAIPAPINGKDGAPGERGEQGLQGERGAAGEDGPQGEAGPAGPDGERGPAGDRGVDGKSIAIDDVAPLLRELVAEIPVPKDGKDGAPGRDGVDGKSVSPEEIEAMIERRAEALFGKWALEFERRGMDLLQRTADRMPIPKDGRDGKDGRDALALDSFDAALDDDGRTVKLSMRAGEQSFERDLTLPIPIDAGVFRDYAGYKRGDTVSFGGSMWIAQKDEPAGRPGVPDSGWRLAVKAGRPGRDGSPGKDYAPPAPVKL